MKKIILTLSLFISISPAFASDQEIRSFDYYSKLSCTEMMNQDSEDKFISFAAREIREDLGDEFCSKVRTEEVFEDIEVDLNRNLEMGRSQFVSPVQYGKLIDGLFEYYLSIQ
jgi:hypothetical protein